MDTPVVHRGATVVIVPAGAASIQDVRLGARTDSIVEGADVILTEDGRLLKSRWTTRGW